MKRKAKRIVPKEPNQTRRNNKNPIQIHDGLGTTMPPDKDVLLIYFDQKGEAELADDFFNVYNSCGWKTQTGGTIRNWKVCATEWIYNYRQKVKRSFRRSPFYSESL
ncbi:MAG: hypothetical protein AAGC65_12545 [Mucilaginibacter sp.]|uniref:hypothetical protein n=1 Tax=Mucilaginibacter sp. TaxID=1882438 RepID=UPI0031AB5899